jgi:hypothetical protein
VDRPPIEPVWQVVFGAVHRLFEQHASPSPPHVPHAPAAHVPVPVPHEAPAATHVLVLLAPVPELTQQPPSRHRLPGQQVWPEPPQAVHVDDEPPGKDVVVVHVVFGAVQIEFVQQAMLLPPQVPQAESAHVPPPAALGQMTPLARHKPATQQPPLAQALPVQHG